MLVPAVNGNATSAPKNASAHLANKLRSLAEPGLEDFPDGVVSKLCVAVEEVRLDSWLQ